MANDSVKVESFFAAVLSGLTVYTSLVLTILCFYVVLFRKVFSNHSFAWLTASLAVADGGVLLVHGCWSVPLMLLGYEYQLDCFICRKMGHLALVFQTGVLHNMLLIAINRYVAIVKFQDYKIWFSKERTKKNIILTWTATFLCGLLWAYPGCDFVFDPKTFVWVFVESPCQPVTVLFDFAYSLIILLIILILNLLAGIRLIQTNKETANLENLNKQQIGTAKKTSPRSSTHKQHERRFFIQTCVNVTLFVLMFISFHVISGFARPGTLEPFITTTCIWQISHATNAWVLFVFNKEVRKGICRCC